MRTSSEQSHAPPKGIKQSLALSKAWKLPFPGQSRRVASYNKIKEEFQKLDILGEGKLTFLTMKSALQMYDIHVDDTTLRSWLKVCDQGDKGFVDLKDYVHIHESMASAYVEDSSTPNRLENASTERKSATRDIAREKLLRIAFDKYDLDQDGFISAEDLMVAAEAGLLSDSRKKGKVTFTYSDAKEWIHLRDHSGNNAVSFEDFYKYYC